MAFPLSRFHLRDLEEAIEAKVTEIHSCSSAQASFALGWELHGVCHLEVELQSACVGWD